jgi:CBS domain-containing protein
LPEFCRDEPVDATRRRLIDAGQWRAVADVSGCTQEGGIRMTNRRMEEIIRNQRPATLPGSATVREACAMMHKRKIGAVLVTNAKGGLAGIFTGRDLVKFVAAGKDPGSVMLRAVMTKNPHTMPPGRTAIEALRLMYDGGFRHIPVVNEGVIVGIVSRGDFRGLEHDRLDVETGYWERIG